MAAPLKTRELMSSLPFGNTSVLHTDENVKPLRFFHGGGTPQSGSMDVAGGRGGGGVKLFVVRRRRGGTKKPKEKSKELN